LQLYLSSYISQVWTPCLPIAFVWPQRMQQSDNLHGDSVQPGRPVRAWLRWILVGIVGDAIVWDLSTACVTWEFLWSNDRKIM